jgi:two-component system chemotaxis sensor kinase CheA
MEMIADPLTHLLRNAVDHGLEQPDQRRAAGKPDIGKLRIAAYQQGGHVYIEVTDDGVGLDRDRIVARALQSGLLGPDQTVSDEEALALIMRPGFSTAATVTQLSGRGVGRDVVKRNVEALGGSLTVRSARGQGTMFRIELPLTLAMLDGQVLQVGGQAFVLPLVAITESVCPVTGSVHTLADRSEVVVVRGATLPVVVKSLDTGFGKPDGMAAATILGDGQVALILDVPGLVRLASNGRRRTAA